MVSFPMLAWDVCAIQKRSRRRFVSPPFESFMADHPQLVEEVADAEPFELAGG